MTNDLFGAEPPVDLIGKLDKHGLSADTHKVALASALLWTYRTRTDLYSVLPHLGLKNSDGRNFTAEKVKAGLDELRRKKLLEEHPQPVLGAVEVVLRVQRAQDLVVADQLVEPRHQELEGLRSTDFVVERPLRLCHGRHCPRGRSGACHAGVVT